MALTRYNDQTRSSNQVIIVNGHRELYDLRSLLHFLKSADQLMKEIGNYSCMIA